VTNRRWAACGTSLAAAVLIGCSATSRHKALTRIFDGVPPLQGGEPVIAGPATATTLGAPSSARPGSQHGPYAAKLCDACHTPGAANALVAPAEQLCLRCHDLDLDQAYVHGPLVSGGCLVCHDPHSSRHEALLVSESGTFCLGCHDAQDVARIEGHADITEGCTTCHDAHGSDVKYLLK
jgi:predicted CXXCH cytochrome family protein